MYSGFAAEFSFYMICDFGSGNWEDSVTNFTEQSESWEANKKFPLFMEYEGSLPCSQQPTNCPYREPDEYSLRTHPIPEYSF